MKAPAKGDGQLRILSIDGGGIRGILPAKVLAEIEDMTGKRIADLFDVIAGTSTGGILALGLTCPGDDPATPKHKATDLVDLYVNKGADIFTKSWLREREVLLQPKYVPINLEQALKDYLGDARLKDAVTRVTVTAYETERRAPFFFRSFKAKQDPQHDYLMRDVARATSAAPTFFPPHRIDAAPDYFSLVDGGVFANNPGMCAYVDALAIDRARSDQVIMVSLGTGNLTRPLLYKEINEWGELHWVQPIISVMMDGVSNATEYQLGQILGPGNYYRLQATLDMASDEMDDASDENIRKLVLQAGDLIDKSADTLSRICERLTSPA
jgi:uncharacterized protein